MFKNFKKIFWVLVLSFFVVPSVTYAYAGFRGFDLGELILIPIIVLIYFFIYLLFCIIGIFLSKKDCKEKFKSITFIKNLFLYITFLGIIFFILCYIGVSIFKFCIIASLSILLLIIVIVIYYNCVKNKKKYSENYLLNLRKIIKYLIMVFIVLIICFMLPLMIIGL